MPESVRDRPTSAWEHIWMFTKARSYFWDFEAARQPQTGNTHSRGRGSVYAPKITVPGLGIKNNRSFQAAMVEDAPADGLANMRNFWLLSSEPNRDAHYAAFPSEIPRRCILAATSEKGACPSCGAPWVRVVERKPNPSKWANLGEDLSGGAAVTANPQTSKGLHRNGDNAEGPRPITTGWQPGCSCPPAAPVPCVVLDPFGGSGTTGLVADRLGRDAILIELNREYAEIARRRIANDAPMLTAGAVTVSTPEQLNLNGVDLFDTMEAAHIERMTPTVALLPAHAGPDGAEVDR